MRTRPPAPEVWPALKGGTALNPPPYLGKRWRLGPSWAILGRLGTILGRFGAILGRLGALLGVSCGVLGASWGVLAAKPKESQGDPF